MLAMLLLLIDSEEDQRKFEELRTPGQNDTLTVGNPTP